MRYLNNVLYKVAYQRLLQVWSMTFLYKGTSEVQEFKAQKENYFAHSMGNLPDRRMLQASTPRNAPPCSRGSYPDPTSVGERGGLANPFYNHYSQKPPVKVARCQNCINRIIIDSQNHAATGGGCNRAQAQSSKSKAQSPKPNIGLLFSYPFTLHHACISACTI